MAKLWQYKNNLIIYLCDIIATVLDCNGSNVMS